MTSQTFMQVHDEKETSDLQKRTHEVDQTQTDSDRVKAIENKYSKRENSEEKSEKVEAKYEKKVDYRCEDVFSLGVESCRQVFKETELKCLDKLGVIGKLLCLPLKLTVLCEIVRLLPGATGMNCDAMDAVNPGFGESFDTAENSAEALDKNFDVNIQYKVVKNPEVLSKLTVDEVTKSIKYEFELRKQWIDFVFSIFQNILAFMFLKVLWSAYSYNKEYTMDFRYDNFYITEYFRHIDQRRRELKKVTLIPLKKLEQNTVITPASVKMSKVEKKSLGMGSLFLFIKMFFMGIVVFVDKIMYEILMIINRNSKIEYEQKGIHRVDVHVHGTGAMAHLIRTMLQGFDQEHHINQEVSNQKCLPRPSKTEQSILITLLVIYIIAWLILIFQAYGLRLRRAIAAFFYRKREKKRVLYLYNDMLKKRKGFLRHARTIIRRRAKERKLEGEIGIFHILAKRCKSCPGLKRFLRKLGQKQLTCLVCKEGLNNKGVQCDTTGCNFAYCSTCWKDIGRDCYACRNEEDWTSSDSSDQFEAV